MYQVIVLRTDLKMRKGKSAAQSAHASVKAALEVYQKENRKYWKWNNTGHKKVVLRVTGEEALLNIYNTAKDMGLPCSLIWDIGLTQIAPAHTAVAIGPCDDKILQELTGHLKLVS